jgi:translation initiation factor 1
MKILILIIFLNIKINLQFKSMELHFKNNNKKIHIRIQQRNSRKSITIIEGFDETLDLKKILKYMKKNFNCNGKVFADTRYGKIIQLQGDQRMISKDFMIDMNIISTENIVIHGS